MLPKLIWLSADTGGHQVRAAVSPLGASIQQLWVDGVSVVRGSETAIPTSGSGIVLAPWPNRVRGGSWMLDGQTQQLELTEAGPGNAIHGLLATTEYAVGRVSGRSIVLSAPIRQPAGYPFDLATNVEYRIVADGIAVHHRIVNRGNRAAPVGLGVHPYVRLGATPAEKLKIAISAERTLLLGVDNLPLESVAVDGTPYDLRQAVGVRSSPAHACFTDLAAPDGRVRLRLIGEVSAVEVWADRRFRWAQLYVTADFPGLERGELAIALEPMTAPPDALNSGIDLHWLQPGQRWSRDWGISLLRLE
ncbi:MAG: aldose epimerase [Microbacteriaceae bacterium]|nr:aldose epimerase [Microbacteriaceae bacterium]